MPGTVGTLFGWLLFHVYTLRWPDIMTPKTWAWVIVIGFIVGVWTCEKTGRALGVADHGAIVWDEIIRQFERRYKGGFGVMADDILAAFFTLLALALWRFV